MAGEEGLGLEYEVNFDVEKGAAIAEEKLLEIAAKWQKILDGHKLQINYEAPAQADSTSLGSGRSKSIKDESDSVKGLKSELASLEKGWGELYIAERKATGGDGAESVDRYKELIEGAGAYKGTISQLIASDEKFEKAQRDSDLKKVESKRKAIEATQILDEKESSIDIENNQKRISRDAKILMEKEVYENKLIEIQSKANAKAQQAENNKAVSKVLTPANTTGTFSMDDNSIAEIEAKLRKLIDSVVQFNLVARKVGFDDDKLSGATKRAYAEMDRLQQKLAALKAGFAGQSLDKLLNFNPKSLQEANALMAELSKRRDQLNRNDGGYVDSITNINKKQKELSDQNAKALSQGIEKEKSIHAETSAYEKQSTVISNLKNIAATYLSIYEAGRLIKNIAEITGQFELQQKSLSAILRDADAANKIFSQVKTLAIVSPFQFKDLLSYTKQLAAYRIETSTLYDTMKNLADVSAGLGVDMSRIILAYGQVSAASVLRGQELRQFTEAGIPLVSLLADKFSELEGRVVSTGEVFGKISQRLVPFQMVKDIFLDMSAEGGMFYNMQEIQAETLTGKISNLTDAYQIMFNSIGSSSAINGVLKGGVDLLMNMAKNWEDIAVVILPVVGAIGMYKAGLLGAIAVQKVQSILTGQSAIASQAMIIANEKEAAALALKTAAGEANLIVNTSQNAADVTKSVLSAYNVSSLKQETAALAVRKLVLKAGADEQKVANLATEISTVLQARGIAVTEADIIAKGIQTVATENATTATVGLGAAMKASMIANPYAWLFAAIAVVVSLTWWITSAIDKSNALKNELSKIGDAGAVESGNMVDRFKALAKTATDSTKSVKEHNDALKTLKQAYGDILPDYLLTVDGLNAVTDKYAAATKAIEDYVTAKTKEKQIAAITDGNDSKKIVKDYGTITDSLKDMGVESNLAKSAMEILRKEIVAGGVSVSETPNRLAAIVNELTGKQYNIDALKGAISATWQYNMLLQDQKKQIADINNLPDDNIISAKLKFKDVQDNVSDAVSQIQRGITEKGVKFDESIYQFNERKSQKQIDMLTDFLVEKTGLTENRIQQAVNGMTIHFADPLKLGWDAFVNGLVKKIQGVKEDKFSGAMNGIVATSFPTPKVGSDDLYTKPNESGMDFIKRTDDAYKEHLKTIKEVTKAGAIYKDQIDISVTANEKLNGYSRMVNGVLVYTAGLKELAATEKKVLDTQGLGDDKAAKKTADERNRELIKSLEDRAALLKQANQKYDELTKAGLSSTDAKSTTDTLFKGQLKPSEIPTTDADLSKSLKVIKGQIAAIPKGTQPAFKLGLEINTIDVKIVTDELKLKLKAIQDEFDSSKKRIDLFKNIFDVTSDFDLAGRIAASFEGNGTTSIETAMKVALKQAFDSTSMLKLADFTDAKGNVDYAKANSSIDSQLRVKGQEENVALLSAQKQLNISKDFKEKEVTELLKGLETFKTFETKRVDIIRKGTREREDIQNIPNITAEQKDVLTKQSDKKQASDISKNTLEQFKGSDTWATVFGDLDKVSAPVIDRLKKQLEDFRESSKGTLPIADLKELTKTIEDLSTRTSQISIGEFFTAMTKDYKIPQLISDLAAANSEMEKMKLINDANITIADTAKVKSTNADAALAIDPTNTDKLDAQIAAKDALDTANNNLTTSTENYSKSVTKATGAEATLTKAQNAKIAATSKAIKANSETITGFTDMKAIITDSITALYDITDALGVVIPPETKAMLDGLTKGLTAVIAVLTVVGTVMTFVAWTTSAAGAAIWASMLPVLAILAPILAVVAAFAIFKAIKMNGINDQLAVQAKIVEDLQTQYDNLGKQMETALGTDWLKDYNAQLVGLKGQIEALGKQAEIEKSKGKDSKPEDLKKIQDDLKAKEDAYAESSKKLQQFVSGTDLSSSAKDFASAWLDSYKSFGNTTDAMKAKFKDMLNNMVVNTLLAKAMEIALRPVFTAMENAAADGVYTPAEIADIVKKTSVATTNTDATMNNIMDGLKAAGVDMRDTTTNLTGVSKGISGVTEDTALLLGGYLDSIRFRLFAYFDALGATKSFDIAGSMASLMIAQNSQINHLLAISGNTLRSAVASENLSAKIDSVFSPANSGHGFAINVNA